jgi:hypothetical protein
MKYLNEINRLDDLFKISLPFRQSIFFFWKPKVYFAPPPPQKKTPIKTKKMQDKFRGD